MVNKSIHDDLLVSGKGSLSVAKIKTVPEKTLELLGPVNIALSEGGTTPTLAIAGVDIFDYSTATTYNTIATHILSTETHVIVDHPDSDGAIILQLPEISTLTGTKKYKIQIKGSLKNADSVAGLRSVTLLGAMKTGDATKGDSFDGHGEVVTTTYIGNFHIYFTHGSIEIQSVIGGYTGGTTNGWAILSSHFDKDKSRKDPVRLASTANVVLATGLIASQTIDGVTLKEHDKVLLKDQSDASQNGVYRVAGIGGEPTRDYQWQKGLYSHGWETKVSEGTHTGKSFSVTSAKSSSLIGTDNLVVSEVNPTVVPGGSDTQIQFNNAGAFAGSSDLTWDGSSLMTPNIVSTDVSTDIDVFSNMTSGSINLGSGLTTGNLKIGEASTTGNITLGNASQTGKIHILNATNSSSVSTGALVVNGGLGLAKKLFAVDDIHIKANNKKLYCGLGDDVELHHTGSNSYLSSNTGDMRITNTAGSQIYAVSGGGCKIFGNFADVDIQANTADVNIGNSFTSNVNIEVDPTGGGNITMGGTQTSGNINIGNASGTGIVDVKSELRLSNKGSVTQATSPTTTVVLNKPIGNVLIFPVTSLAVGDIITFTVSNSYSEVGSIILVSCVGWLSLSASTRNIANGSFEIRFVNTSNAPVTFGTAGDLTISYVIL